MPEHFRQIYDRHFTVEEHSQKIDTINFTVCSKYA
jgi:hypothetical protein